MLVSSPPAIRSLWLARLPLSCFALVLFLTVPIVSSKILTHSFPWIASVLSSVAVVVVVVVVVQMIPLSCSHLSSINGSKNAEETDEHQTLTA